METDPFQGDVKALAGPQWVGVFRRRMGSYRLLFTVDPSQPSDPRTRAFASGAPHIIPFNEVIHSLGN
jgi:hypothetical protein